MTSMEGLGPQDSLELHVTTEFLTLAFDDQEAGGLRPLEEYQRLFPGHEALVAREHAELLQDADRPAEAEDRQALFRLGRFLVLRPLGHGGQGRVYRARDPSSGRAVALKTLELAGSDLGARLRLEREAEALSRLDDPGLVRVLALERERDVPFLVMELVEGESLATRLARLRDGHEVQDDRGDAAWPLAERLALVERLARSLHTAHEQGILHRDVKPQNVIVRPDGTPVLVDFGLAFVEGIPRLTRPGGKVGTPAYVPPERLRGERDFERRGDVYMLGVLLFECLERHPPFEARTQRLLQEQILHREPPALRRVDSRNARALGAVLATALAKESADRYVSALAFAEDLGRVRRGERVSLQPRPLGARLVRLCRRRPRLALAGGLLLGATLIGALATSSLGRATRRTLAQLEQDTAVRTAVMLTQEAALSDWPELPESLAAMQGWLARAEDTRSRLPEDGAREASLGRIRERLDSSLDEVRARRERATVLAAVTLEEPARLWEETRNAVAASPLYGGLLLEPQLGLVPLGPDPGSGLQEFCLPRTGSRPARDVDGHLVADGESALVLVLLPGGSFWMGAEPPGARASAPHALDRQATDNGEWPAHLASVGPFFLAKHEMTQGQWLRLTGENPSRWQPGSDARDPITLAHPVENVSWTMAVQALHRIGLELPSEAQWEYAARAGTETPWSTGATAESLHGHANLLDLAAVQMADFPPALALPDVFDGHVEHAPVGSFLPNAFGLHDVHGNVWELCADEWRHYPGHPLAWLPASSAGPPQRVLRGGGYADGAWHCRSSRRDYAPPSERTFSRGLRPARDLGHDLSHRRRAATPEEVR